MNKPRLSRRILLIGSAILFMFALAASYYVYLLQRQEAKNQLRLQVEAQHQREQVAASVVAILEMDVPTNEIERTSGQGWVSEALPNGIQRKTSDALGG